MTAGVTSESPPKEGGRRSLALLPIALGFIAAVVSAMMYGWVVLNKTTVPYADFRERVKLDESLTAVKIEAARSRERAEAVEAELQRWSEQLARLAAKPVAPKGSEASAELAKQLLAMRITLERVAGRMDGLDKQSGAVNERMAKIEGVILGDPQKALELPLLKRDLQGLQQQIDRDLNALRAENARVYDFMKWLVGLMALVSLGLVGTAVSNVFKREAPRASETGSGKESGQTSAK
jgi:hypothetical protein